MDLKDRFDSDTGRPEFGLRGQCGGTQSNKGTAANSLSGNHAHVAKLPGCLRLAKNADRLLSIQNLGETMVVTVAGRS